MKKISFLLYVSLVPLAAFSQTGSHNKDTLIFTAVDEMPGYPGGDEARIKFIQSTLVYPETAKKAGIQGKVFVTFVVEKDGSFTNIHILRGIGGGCDEEVIRIIKAMPKWSPGKLKGKPVRVQFNLPVKFTLQDNQSKDNQSNDNQSLKVLPQYMLDTMLNNARMKMITYKLENEDAVMLLQFRTVINHFEIIPEYANTNNQQGWLGWNSPSTVVNNERKMSLEIVFQRIKVLSQKGAEEYSKIYIPKSTSGNIVKIIAKSIKPDHTEIPVKEEDIKEVQSVTDGVFDWKQGHYRFSVPGVEAGDELEIVYTINRTENFSVSDDYFFHTYLPTVQSTLFLFFPNAMVVSIRNYNGLQSPKQRQDTRSYWYEYSKYNLAALHDIDHAILNNDLPYCRYQILGILNTSNHTFERTKISNNSWNDFALDFISSWNKVDLKGTKSKYFDQFVAEHYAAGDETPQSGFRKLIRFIFDNMTIDNNNKKPENNSGYYLYRRSLPVRAVYRLYSDLLTKLGIEYYFCLGAIKSRGWLDTVIVSDRNFSSFFFAYQDENDSLRFVFPENSIYKINPEEINPYYSGASFIQMSASSPGQHVFGKLPDYPSSFNYKKRRNQVFADLDENILKYDCNTVKAGAISYFDRMYDYRKSKDSLKSEVNNYLMNEMKNFIIDTSYFTGPDSTFPYKYSFHYKGKQKGLLVKVADSLYSVDLSEWLDHTVQPAYSAERIVDYYPDFRYNEQFSYYYIFKTPVEVQNPSSLAGGIDNDFGSYQFSIHQLSDTVIFVQSTYKIIKEKLPWSQYDQIKQLYDQWALFKNTRFLVRIKPRSSAENQ